MQEAIYALLAISLLPTLDCGATDPCRPSDFQHGQSFGGMQDNLGPLNVLQGAIAIFGMLKYLGLICIVGFAYLATLVNPIIALVL